MFERALYGELIAQVKRAKNVLERMGTLEWDDFCLTKGSIFGEWEGENEAGERFPFSEMFPSELGFGQSIALAAETHISSSPEGKLRIKSVIPTEKFPPEPQLAKKLLQTRSPRLVREICRESKWWLSPQGPYGPLIRSLVEHADWYVRAMGRRFRRTNRPSSLKKRAQFASRVLAGALYDMSPRRALNILQAFAALKEASQAGRRR